MEKSDLTTLNLGDKAADNEFGNGGDFNFYFGRSYGESSDPSRHLDGEICRSPYLEGSTDTGGNLQEYV